MSQSVHGSSSRVKEEHKEGHSMKPLHRLLLIFVVSIIGLYWSAVALALNTPYTSYVPFSGQVFSIDAASVDRAIIRSGSTGYSLEYPAEEQQSLISLLNDFQYHCAIPGRGAPGIPLAMGGWRYMIVLRSGEESASYEFGNSWVKIHSIYYYGDKNYFSGVIADLDAAEQAELDS